MQRHAARVFLTDARLRAGVDLALAREPIVGARLGVDGAKPFERLLEAVGERVVGREYTLANSVSPP
jgi:hypothetical protein